MVRKIASDGGTPLLVAEDRRVLGAIHLKDIVKGSLRLIEAFRRRATRAFVAGG